MVRLKRYFYQLVNAIDWWLFFCRIERTAEEIQIQPQPIEEKPRAAVPKKKYNFWTKPRTQAENYNILTNIMLVIMIIILIEVVILGCILHGKGVI